MVINITHNMFARYVEVQKSGVTNMWNISLVSDLADLEENEVMEIIKNYSKYSDKYTVKSLK